MDQDGSVTRVPKKMKIPLDKKTRTVIYKGSALLHTPFGSELTWGKVVMYTED